MTAGAVPAVQAVGARRHTLSVLVALAVAFAFADSSIVVLALPELYGRLHTSIEGVAWIVTTYNVAVAVVALSLVLVIHRWRPATALVAGLAVFCAASVASALANSLEFLLAARAVQGAGAALLLAGSLPVLRGLTGSGARASALWTMAGTFGAAFGPAVGGALTQAFSWRAIFAVQAPVAALALLAARSAHVDARDDDARVSLRRTLPANTALGLVFAALVGALFLSVILVITVWGYSPLGGAVVVSALPAAALAVRPLARRLTRFGAAGGGAALLALGLCGLALLPSSSLAYTLPALALCGAGVGLAVPPLSHAALDVSSLTRTGAFTVGVRHVGLVVALASIAPLLASALPPAGEQAKLKATSVLLDAPVGLATKIPVAIDLSHEFDRAQAGAIPDLAAPFNAHGAKDDATLAHVRDRLLAAIEGTLTPAFRWALLLSALFALGALVVAFAWLRWDVRRGVAAAIVVALLAVGAALAIVEAARGNASNVAIGDPCSGRAPFARGGLDGTIQRVVLDGLDRAACSLGTTREHLVLSLAQANARRDAAVRSGVAGAVDAAGRRGDIPGFLVPLVRRFVETAPIRQLVEGGVKLTNLFG